MPSKVYSKALKGTNYGVIQRGASFTLPVEVKDEEDRPIDLTGLYAEFTVKKVKTDFDRHDDKAYISKTFLPQDPEHGKFYVMLTSDDTDFEPGKFYFDVELHNRENGMVFRLFTCEFTLDGGPTNRRVNKGSGQWPTGDTITVIALAEGNPIVVIAPTVNLDGDVFGQLATLMEAVDKCEQHVAECEVLDQQVQDEVAKLREELENSNGQLADHEDDLEEIFQHLKTHDDAIKTIVEALKDHLEAIQAQGKRLFDLENIITDAENGVLKRLTDLETKVAELEKEFRFHWKG